MPKATDNPTPGPAPAHTALSIQPGRRSMLAGAGAALAVAIPTAAIATMPGNPDADLIRACEQHPSNLAACNASPDADGPIRDAYFATRDAISNAEPQTMAGILAKARVAVVEATGVHGQESWAGSMGENWSQDIVKDLLRLAGHEVTFAPEPDYVPKGEPLDRPHPDAALIEAAQAFLAAEKVSRTTCWAEDDLDDREGDRADALARRAAAEAEQGGAAKVLIERKATTLAGFQSKARAAVAWYGDTPPDDGAGGDILWSLACDLAGEV